jgi:cytochrome P450
VTGLPPGDGARLQVWSAATADASDPERGHRAGLERAAYVGEMADGWDSRAPVSLPSRLVQAEQSGLLSRPELVSSVIQVLLGGDETTVNLVGNAVLELLRHPEMLLNGILHDWDDERSAVLLGHCRHAIAPDGHLLVLEQVRPDQLAGQKRPRP